MNPRFACRVVRLWSALREDHSPRHAASCADCQAYFRASSTLESALRRHAPATLAEPPANFESNLLRAVRTAQSSETAVASPAQPWRTFVTAGTVAAVLVFGSMLYQRRAASPTATTAEASALVESVGTLSNRLAENVIPSAGTFIAENPLQDEITAVYADAKSALDFLALNFLPQRSASTSAPTPRRTG